MAEQKKKEPKKGSYDKKKSKKSIKIFNKMVKNITFPH